MIEKLNSDELLAMSTAHLYLIFFFDKSFISDFWSN